MDGDVRLRPLDLRTDCEAALPWYADPEVLRFSEGASRPYDLPTVRRMYESLAEQGELYVIEARTERGWLPVGDVTLSPRDLPIVIGDPAFRSRGIGRRVIRLLVARARELGWDCLRVERVHADNLRSRRLFEGIGFRPAGADVDAGGTRFVSYQLSLGAGDAPGPVST